MKRLFVALLLLPVATAAQTPTFSEAQRADGLAQIKEAGRLLADKLRNLRTGRFRGVYLFKTIGRDGQEHISMCGEVNGQNGFGGMTGFEPFTVAGDMLLTGSTGILNASMVCNGSTPRVRDTLDYTADLRKAFDANAGQ